MNKTWWRESVVYVINMISKPQGLPEMRQEVLSRCDCITVGQASSPVFANAFDARMAL